MSEHTPTPWEAQDYSEGDDGVGIIGLRTNNGVPYLSPTNGLVAWATLHPTEMDANDPARAQANAAFIVKAVNNHDALVKALQNIIEENDEFRKGMPDNWDGDPLEDACTIAKVILASVAPQKSQESASE